MDEQPPLAVTCRQEHGQMEPTKPESYLSTGIVWAQGLDVQAPSVLLRLHGVKKSRQDMRFSWTKEGAPVRRCQARPQQAGRTLGDGTRFLKLAKQHRSVLLGQTSESLLWLLERPCLVGAGEGRAGEQRRSRGVRKRSRASSVEARPLSGLERQSPAAARIRTANRCPENCPARQ